MSQDKPASQEEEAEELSQMRKKEGALTSKKDVTLAAQVLSVVKAREGKSYKFQFSE